MAAALSTASARLRGAAAELPKIEQRKQLSDQADRFDQMLGEMLNVAREDLAGLACSVRQASTIERIFKCNAECDQHPSKSNEVPHQ